MKIGLDTYCFHISLAAGVYDIFQVLDRMGPLGLEGLQININGENGRFLGADPSDVEHIKRVREAIEERGLFVEVGGRGTHPDEIAWQLELCANLGADILRTVVVFEDTVEHTVQRTLLDLEAVLPLAHDLGIRIALENHEGLTAQELVTIINTIDDDYLGVCLDTGNGLAVYERPFTTVYLLAPYAITSHIKDQRLIQVNGIVYSVGVRLGSGDINLPKILPILLDKSRLNRLLIQDTTGYATLLNPFKREDLNPGDFLRGIPDMSREDLEREGILLSLDGLNKQELRSWALISDKNIEDDVAYLRRIMSP